MEQKISGNSFRKFRSTSWGCPFFQEFGNSGNFPFHLTFLPGMNQPQFFWSCLKAGRYKSQTRWTRIARLNKNSSYCCMPRSWIELFLFKWAIRVDPVRLLYLPPESYKMAASRYYTGCKTICYSSSLLVTVYPPQIPLDLLFWKIVDLSFWISCEYLLGLHNLT